jgi:hypothetical protein
MKSGISLVMLSLGTAAGLFAARIALAGPLAPCGYYPNSLTPRTCGNFYPQPSARPPTARCRDGTYSYGQRQPDACTDHGGVQNWLW